MAKSKSLPQWADNLQVGPVELCPARVGQAGDRNGPPSCKVLFTFEGERPEAFFTFLRKTGSRACWISLAVVDLEVWNPGEAVSLEFGQPKIKIPSDPTGKTVIEVKATLKAEIAANLLRLVAFRAAMIDAGDLDTAFVECCPIQTMISEAPAADPPAKA